MPNSIKSINQNLSDKLQRGRADLRKWVPVSYACSETYHANIKYYNLAKFIIYGKIKPYIITPDFLTMVFFWTSPAKIILTISIASSALLRSCWSCFKQSFVSVIAVSKSYTAQSGFAKVSEKFFEIIFFVSYYGEVWKMPISNITILRNCGSERLRDKMVRLIKSETVKPPNDKQG